MASIIYVTVPPCGALRNLGARLISTVLHSNKIRDKLRLDLWDEGLGLLLPKDLQSELRALYRTQGGLTWVARFRDTRQPGSTTTQACEREARQCRPDRRVVRYWLNIISVFCSESVYMNSGTRGGEGNHHHYVSGRKSNNDRQGNSRFIIGHEGSSPTYLLVRRGEKREEEGGGCEGLGG